jgi:hypothetical protein
VLEDLLEQGELQLAVAVCEVLASTAGALQGEQLTDLLDIDKSRLRELYLGYIGERGRQGGERVSHDDLDLVGA